MLMLLLLFFFCSVCDGRPKPGTVKWKNKISGIAASSPDGSVVYLRGDGQLSALDAATGTTKWSFPTGNGGSGPLLSHDGSTVYVGSAEKSMCYAVHAANGTLKWGFNAESEVRSELYLLPDGLTIYFGTISYMGEGKLYALDTWTGAYKWDFDSGGVDDVVLSPDGSMLYVVSDSFLYAVDTNTTQMKWQIQCTESGEMDSFVATAVSPDNSVLYAGCNLWMLAMDASSGEKKWSFQIEFDLDQVVSEPVLSPDGSVVYFGTIHLGVYAVDTTTGTKKWLFDAGSVYDGVVVSSDGSMVYVGSDRDTLFALDATTGKLKWSNEMKDSVSLGSLSPDESVVYAADEFYTYAVWT